MAEHINYLQVFVLLLQISEHRSTIGDLDKLLKTTTGCLQCCLLFTQQLTPTDIVTVRTEEPTILCFQLGVNFSDFTFIYRVEMC